MKTILLGSINSRFSHTNLAIRYLSRYAKKVLTEQVPQTPQAPQNSNVQPPSIKTMEWTISQPLLEIIRTAVEEKPDMLLLSVYIWNRELSLKAVAEIKKILPDTFIGLGGPEVSWQAEDVLTDNSAVDFIMVGEGELTMAELCLTFSTADSPQNFRNQLSSIKGLHIQGRHIQGKNALVESTVFTGQRPLITDLNCVPFPYTEDGTLQGKLSTDIDLENHIVYYETSRGCPFRCAYCLSSIDKMVRYFPLERVFQELQFFLDHEFHLIKFVDRTFNLDNSRYLAIWDYIIRHQTGKTAFHFEIAPHLLCDQAFKLLAQALSGTIQFEIGIQSTNPETLKLVNRATDLQQTVENLKRIPKNIHVHLDLIAGLPAEDFESFKSSYDFTINFAPQMLQLGFLKILSGTHMEQLAKADKKYLYLDTPPYEVLQSPALPYADMQKIKAIEHLTDIYYNSGSFTFTFKYLLKQSISLFDFFYHLSQHLEQQQLLYLPRKLKDHFKQLTVFFAAYTPTAPFTTELSDLLKLDFIRQGKLGSFPEWYTRNYSKEEHEAALRTHTTVKSTRESYSLSDYEIFATTAPIEAILQETALVPSPNPTHGTSRTTGNAVLFLYPNRSIARTSNYTTESHTQYVVL